MGLNAASPTIASGPERGLAIPTTIDSLAGAAVGAAVGSGATVTTCTSPGFSTICVTTTGSADSSGQHPARAAPATVRALRRKKSRRLNLLSAIFTSSLFGLNMRPCVLIEDLSDCALL